MQAGGGVQANISKHIIVKHPIPIPPYAEQKRIVAKIEELFATIDKIKGILWRLNRCLQRFGLPVYNFIHDCPLFGCCATQIDARGLDAFVPHQVGKQCNIIEAVKKILCKTMPKRVRVNDLPF